MLLPATTKDFDSKVQEIINSNPTSLNKAIKEIADKENYNAEEIKRLVEKTNIAATVKLLGDSEDKRAEMELADFAKIITADTSIKTAVDTLAKPLPKRVSISVNNNNNNNKDNTNNNAPPVTFGNMYKLKKQAEDLSMEKAKILQVIHADLESLRYVKNFNKFASEAIALNGELAEPILSAIKHYDKIACDRIIDDSAPEFKKIAELIKNFKRLSEIVRNANGNN